MARSKSKHRRVQMKNRQAWRKRMKKRKVTAKEASKKK
jgi:hypothetical protein